MAVSHHLKDIAKLVETGSGYPYPEGSRVGADKAFAFGLTMGTLWALVREWENKEEGYRVGGP